MSRRAVWLCSDEDNDRLVQIAKEHSRLAVGLMNGRRKGTLSIKQASDMVDRLEALRKERRAILDKYEDEADRVIDEY